MPRGNNNDQVRRHNLSVVLGLVHRSRGMARSEITRQTGLNRSTIGGLVAELVARGLVVEQTPAQPGLVGRPSPVVVPSPRVVGIAVNPEIDSVTVGIVGLGGEVVQKVRFDTGSRPTVAEAVRITAAVIAGMRGELDERYTCVGIGVAVPGLVRESDGVVRLAPHLDWHDEPFAERLAEATGYPVAAANDAGLGAMGEKLFGAGREHDDLVYLNGGASGIGGGIIVNGRPLRGVGGYAGEFGHIKVDDGIGGDDGSLERRVNRAELLAATGLATADADRLASVIAAADDPVIAELVRRQLGFLAVALRNAVNVLNPEVIVLGGFLGTIFEADPEFLVARVAEQTLEAPLADVRIARAELGADLLMIGAAELAFRALLDDPASVGEVALEA